MNNFVRDKAQRIPRTVVTLEARGGPRTFVDMGSHSGGVAEEDSEASGASESQPRR